MFLRESARVWCGMRRYSSSRITLGLGRGGRGMAVRAWVAVSHKIFLARKRPRLVRDAPVFQQSNHARQLHHTARRVDVLRGFLLRRRHPLRSEEHTSELQ